MLNRNNILAQLCPIGIISIALWAISLWFIFVTLGILGVTLHIYFKTYK